jgi:hypothetical protein
MGEAEAREGLKVALKWPLQSVFIVVTERGRQIKPVLLAEYCRAVMEK